MRILKQSTAINIMVLLTSSVDHITGVSGLTPTVYLSKNCGNFTLISPVVESKGNGWYKIELTTGHTDTIGDMVLHIEDASADPTDVVMSVKAQTIDDIYSLLNTTSQVVDDILVLCADIPNIVADTTQLLSDIAQISTDISQLSTDFSQSNGDILVLVDELHKIQGLDSGSPMTVTPSTRDAGSIHLDITGDGETSTTVTRT